MTLPLERLASLHIYSLSASLMPDASASAVIVKFPKRDLLLTVAHATGDQKNWGLALRYVAGKGVETYQLGPMNFLLRIPVKKRKKKSIDVDFSYVEVPKDLCPQDEELDPLGNVLASYPKEKLLGTVSEPSKDEVYCFYGYTRHRLDDKFNLNVTPKHETGLKFNGEVDDLYRFECRSKYHGYEEYQG